MIKMNIIHLLLVIPVPALSRPVCTLFLLAVLRAHDGIGKETGAHGGVLIVLGDTGPPDALTFR